MISKIKILLKNPGFLFQYSNRMKRLEKILHSDQNTIKSYFDESEVCWSYVENKMKNIENSVRIGHERLQLLYTCVRILKPKVMVETGVAGGSTSFTILSAMKKNGFGNLYSIDIDNSQYDNREFNYKIGWLVPDNLRKNWTLILGDSKKELPLILNSLKSIDIFFHDSDHSYEHMIFEFESVWNYLSKQKVILSDDINKNISFDEIVKKNKMTSEKFFGFGICHKI